MSLITSLESKFQVRVLPSTEEEDGPLFPIGAIIALAVGGTLILLLIIALIIKKLKHGTLRVRYPVEGKQIAYDKGNQRTTQHHQNGSPVDQSRSGNLGYGNESSNYSNQRNSGVNIEKGNRSMNYSGTKSHKSYSGNRQTKYQIGYNV